MNQLRIQICPLNAAEPETEVGMGSERTKEFQAFPKFRDSALLKNFAKREFWLH